ncbi:MAG: hypothetical protein JWQ42_4562 [Edaphobacter sp.]|nr:hypothetical protein [Edaphobacter sp.]
MISLQPAVKKSSLRSTRRAEFWLLAVLFLVALCTQLIAVRRNLNVYDESLSLYGADRVLRGEVPYRDFWTMYGPAQFYLLAGFFKLFGVSALVGRIYDALIRSGIACACFVLADRLSNRRYAALAFAAVLLWLTCIDNPAYNFPIFPALLVSLISCLFLSRYLRDPSRSRPLFIAGALVGVTVSFRHDSGFYLCVAQAITLAWSAVATRVPGASPLRVLFDLRRPALLYLAGIFTIAVPLLLFLLWKIPLHDLFYDLFYVPGKIYPRMRSLPFEGLDELRHLRQPFRWEGRAVLEQSIVFFPVLVCLASLAALLISSETRRIFDHHWQRYTFALLTLLGSLFFIKGLIRVSPLQMMQSILVGTILIAVLLGRISRLNRAMSLFVGSCAFYLIVCTAPLLADYALFTRTNLSDLHHPETPRSLYRTCHPPAGLERARCLIVDPDSAAAIQEIERRTSPTDRIFVGAGRHDKLFWNDVRFYFASGRPSVTKWYDMHPGVQTTFPIQNEIIDSIRHNSPKLIVLNSTWDDTSEPNDSRYSSGVTALDDYIRDNYAPQRRLGNITILVPNEPAPNSIVKSK